MGIVETYVLIYFTIVIVHALTRVYAPIINEVVEVKTVYQSPYDAIIIEDTFCINEYDIYRRRDFLYDSKREKEIIIQDMKRKFISSLDEGLVEIVTSQDYAKDNTYYKMRIKILPPTIK